MHVIFDTLIDSFIENKIGIAQHFLSESLALHLTENLVFLYRDNQLKSAGTGEHTVLKINMKIHFSISWMTLYCISMQTVIQESRVTNSIIPFMKKEVFI